MITPEAWTPVIINKWCLIYFDSKKRTERKEKVKRSEIKQKVWSWLGKWEIQIKKQLQADITIYHLYW